MNKIILHPNRRTLIVGSAALATNFAFPSLSNAWIFLFLLRTAGSFAGRTVGGAAARAAARGVIGRSTPRLATRQIQRTSNSHIKRLKRNGYRKNEVPLSERLSKYVGEEVGQSAAEAAFDQIFSQGYEAVVSEDHERIPVGAVSWSTHYGSAPATVMGPYMAALSEIARILARNGYNRSEITKLIFPLTIIEDNMPFDTWESRRPTIFKNPTDRGFFQLRTTQPRRRESLYRVDCYIRGEGDHELRFNDLPVTA